MQGWWLTKDGGRRTIEFSNRPLPGCRRQRRPLRLHRSRRHRARAGDRRDRPPRLGAGGPAARRDAGRALAGARARVRGGRRGGREAARRRLGRHDPLRRRHRHHRRPLGRGRDPRLPRGRRRAADRQRRPHRGRRPHRQAGADRRLRRRPRRGRAAHARGRLPLAASGHRSSSTDAPGAWCSSPPTAEQPLGPDAERRLDDFAELVALALESAQARSELVESRARIVSAGDAERRRLERNLHDGAQQRLVTLSLQLKLAQARLDDDPDGGGRTDRRGGGGAPTRAPGAA